tara:strand:+ start:421 stop:531 length:111 start_codon:yes stop_codon:yes gene_type:complete
VNIGSSTLVNFGVLPSLVDTKGDNARDHETEGEQNE